MPELTANEIAELACTYAALILHDDNVPITAEKINAILAAANVQVAPYWPGLFAKVLNGRNVDDLILNAGGSGGSAPAPAAGGPAAAPAKEEKKEEKKKEEKKEESDEEMGFGLFD